MVLSDGCSHFSYCSWLKIGSKGGISTAIVPPCFLNVKTYSDLPKSTSVTFGIFPAVVFCLGFFVVFFFQARIANSEGEKKLIKPSAQSRQMFV